jgi:general stress protein YciG
MKEDSQQQGSVHETTTSSDSTAEKPRKARGFAAMDRTLVSELAKRGGKAAHKAGTAHQFTSDEARVAGRKGGMATHAKRITRENGTPN